MGKILIIAGDGTAIDHLDYAYSRMKEEGFDVTIAAITKRPIKSSVHWGGPDTYLYYIEQPGYIMPCHAAFDEINPADFDGLLLPGGRAPEYLRNEESCVSIVRHFVENDKPIAALCHAPLLLLATGISGRNMCCADDVGVNVNNSGNTYVPNLGEIPGTPDFVVDGNVVTARGYWHYHSWVREFLTLLEKNGVPRPLKPTPRNARVLILAGEHSSAGQLSHAYERILELGCEAVIAAPKPGIIRTIVDQREEGWDMRADQPGPYAFESLGYQIWTQDSIEQIDPTQFDGVLIPGGRAPEYLQNMKPYQDAVRHFLDANKPIGAICQGTRLILTGGAKGRTLTGLDMIRPEIALDNSYVDAGGEAVIDGNIVTVSARPYYHIWTREFIRLLPEA